MNDFVWTPSGTDITERWKQMGWIPPSQLPAFQDKWNRYKQLALRSLSEDERYKLQQLMTNVVPIGGRR